MKALLLHNIHSGQRDRTAEIASAASRLSSAGWDVEMAACSDVVELRRRTRAAVDAGIESVVVAGGDGTINVAIQELAHQPTALGVLPTGTGNVWAAEMRIPWDVRAATDTLLTGRIAEVDLGTANGRYFLVTASVGFDASVTRQLDHQAKRRLGKLAYVVAGVVEALKLRGEEATITVDGSTSRQRILMLLANNVRLYGGVLAVTPEALADDGLLDVWVFRGQGWMEAALHGGLVLLRLQSRNPEATFFRTASVTIDARNPMPVQVDGDYIGTTPVTISVVPRALRVIVPPGPHPQLRGVQGPGVGEEGSDPRPLAPDT